MNRLNENESTQLSNENRFLMFGQIFCLCHNVMFVNLGTTSHLTKTAHTKKTTNLPNITHLTKKTIHTQKKD